MEIVIPEGFFDPVQPPPLVQAPVVVERREVEIQQPAPARVTPTTEALTTDNNRHVPTQSAAANNTDGRPSHVPSPVVRSTEQAQQQHQQQQTARPVPQQTSTSPATTRPEPRQPASSQSPPKQSSSKQSSSKQSSSKQSSSKQSSPKQPSKKATKKSQKHSASGQQPEQRQPASTQASPSEQGHTGATPSGEPARQVHFNADPGDIMGEEQRHPPPGPSRRRPPPARPSRCLPPPPPSPTSSCDSFIDIAEQDAPEPEFRPRARAARQEADRVVLEAIQASEQRRARRNPMAGSRETAAPTVVYRPRTRYITSDGTEPIFVMRGASGREGGRRVGEEMGLPGYSARDQSGRRTMSGGLGSGDGGGRRAGRYRAPSVHTEIEGEEEDDDDDDDDDDDEIQTRDSRW